MQKLEAAQTMLSLWRDLRQADAEREKLAQAGFCFKGGIKTLYVCTARSDWTAIEHFLALIEARSHLLSRLRQDEGSAELVARAASAVPRGCSESLEESQTGRYCMPACIHTCFYLNINYTLGIKPKLSRIRASVAQSLMLVTALNSKIGHYNAANIAQTAFYIRLAILF
jgi:hypothetical protein